MSASTTMPPPDLRPLLDRCAALVAAARGGRRQVLGITGAPGAGKTTLVLALLEAAAADPRLAGRLAHLPMDGFHLPDVLLRELGRRDRKGAPDTFDPAAYAEVLAAVRTLPRGVVRAPAFDHAVGDPEPDAVEVAEAADLVLTEGNYLLLGGAWRPVEDLLDETWFCDLAGATRLERLVGRHVEAGREPSDAQAWAAGPDEANAVVVAATRARADVVVVDGRVV